MDERTTTREEELRRLRQRHEELARDKAQLELTLEVMRSLAPATDVEQLSERIVSLLMDTIGGHDVVLYYQLGESWHRRACGGPQTSMAELDDERVRQAVEQGRFCDSRSPQSHVHLDSADNLPPARTWVFPLRVGEEVVGALKLDDIVVLDTPRSQQNLSVLMDYVALSLRNALLNHSRLKQAYDDLKQRNEALRREMRDRQEAERQKARLEKQLRHAQKMEALGTLAGGIAHDFNNVLACIVGNADLARMSLSEETDARMLVEDVLCAARRARDLVRHILAFSKHTEKTLGPVRIDQVIEEAFRLLRATLPTSLRLLSEVETDTTVHGDPTQIQQVVMNLCTNAAHAMRQDDTGTLTVRLRKVDMGPGSAPSAQASQQTGHYAELTVCDTGHGIPAEHRDRIFDPYFTTKSQDEGTGLGLSVVHGIVKAHGGWIDVSSEPGKGTQMTVRFRALRPPASTPTRLAASATSLRADGERILVVDDEPAIASILDRGLSHFGYRVVAFTCPHEALRALQRDPTGFDLVLTDHSMPGMSGLALAARASALCTGLPVLLCTGNPASIDKSRAFAEGVTDIAAKPLDIAQLATRVQQLLAQRARAPEPSNPAAPGVPDADRGARQAARRGLGPTAEAARGASERTRHT